MTNSKQDALSHSRTSGPSHSQRMCPGRLSDLVPLRAARRPPAARPRLRCRAPRSRHFSRLAALCPRLRRRLAQHPRGRLLCRPRDHHAGIPLPVEVTEPELLPLGGRSAHAPSAETAQATQTAPARPAHLPGLHCRAWCARQKILERGLIKRSLIAPRVWLRCSIDGRRRTSPASQSGASKIWSR